MHTNRPSRTRALMTTSLAAGIVLVATSDMGWARSDGFRRATFHGGKSSRNLTPRIARNVPHSSIAPASRVSRFNRVHPIINQSPTSSASNGPSQGSAPGSTSRVSSFNRVHPIINQNPTSSASSGSTNGVVSISNGVTKSAISNERGGLTVTSTRPGTITITNVKGSSVTLAGGSVTLSGAATPVKAGAGLQVAHLMNGSTVVAVNPPGKPGTVAFDPNSSETLSKFGLNVAKVFDEAWYIVPVVSYGPPIAAGYGLLQGGVSGAYNSVEAFGKETYKFLTDFF
jgi:hypothetical protein